MSTANIENTIDSNENQSSAKSKGLLYLMIGMLLFSMKGIFIKLSYMTIRMLIALPIYAWVLRKCYLKSSYTQISSKQIILTAIFGLFGYYLASWLDLTGLLYLPANLERLILYSYPSMVLILSIIFLRQKITSKLIISLMVVYVGLFIVFSQDVFFATNKISPSEQTQIMTGALLVLASAFSFSIFFVGSEVMMRKLPSKLFTAIAMISASIGIIVHFSINNPMSDLVTQSPEVYIYGFIIAIFCTVIPSFLVASGVKRVGAATGSIAGGIGPIATLILASIILGESITLIQAAGFAVVLSGLYYLARFK